MQRLLAFIIRDFRVEKSYRLAFIMRFVGIFISIATFFFISQLFGKDTIPQLDAYGGNYFSFVLIGIAFSGLLTVGLNTFSRSISMAQAQGTLEAMLVTPTKLSTIILFSSIWSFIFTSINVVAYLIIGSLIFGADFSGANFLAAFLILALTIPVFSGIGIISASFIIVLKRGDPINWIFGSLSTLMGGTFFPVEVMPDWLQKFAYVFPIFYALRAMRQALIKGASLSAMSFDILALAAMAALVLPLSIMAFKYAIKQAKIDGSLTTY